jgi:hypothetical protein
MHRVMQFPGRILAALLAFAIFTAFADCACLAARHKISPAPSSSTPPSDAPMPCCETASEACPHHPHSSHPDVPCKSTCPHCGQLLLHDRTPSTNFDLTIPTFDLSIPQAKPTNQTPDDLTSSRLDHPDDLSPPVRSTLLELHCALVI